MRELRNTRAIKNAPWLKNYSGEHSKFVTLQDAMYQEGMQSLFELIQKKDKDAFKTIIRLLHEKSPRVDEEIFTFENWFWSVVLSAVYFGKAEFLEKYLHYLKNKLKLDLPDLLSCPYGEDVNVFLIDECITLTESAEDKSEKDKSEEDKSVEAELDIDCLRILIKYGIKFNKLEYAGLCQCFDLLDDELASLLGVTEGQIFGYRCSSTINNMIAPEIRAKVELNLKKYVSRMPGCVSSERF